jgi:Arc/MetJ-type ribon-helix-helix transcriptional regulator
VPLWFAFKDLVAAEGCDVVFEVFAVHDFVPALNSEDAFCALLLTLIYPLDILVAEEQDRSMKKILINIPDDLLEKVDKRAREENMNRSEAVRLALHAWLRPGKYVAPLHRPGFAQIEARIRAAASSSRTSLPAEIQIRKDREAH